MAIETLQEIHRTADDMGAYTDDSGRYVRMDDGQNGWWQPVDKLLPILRGLPPYNPAADDEDAAEAYADWCRATAAAGFFGHNGAEDTMPVPADFEAPQAFA